MFARPFGVTDASTYGFDHSYEGLDKSVMRSGNSITIGFSGARSKLPDLEPLSPGQSRSLGWTLEQMTWLRDDLRVRLAAVLPTVRVATDAAQREGFFTR